MISVTDLARARRDVDRFRVHNVDLSPAVGVAARRRDHGRGRPSLRSVTPVTHVATARSQRPVATARSQRPGHNGPSHNGPVAPARSQGPVSTAWSRCSRRGIQVGTTGWADGDGPTRSCLSPPPRSRDGDRDAGPWGRVHHGAGAGPVAELGGIWTGRTRYGRPQAPGPTADGRSREAIGLTCSRNLIRCAMTRTRWSTPKESGVLGRHSQQVRCSGRRAERVCHARPDPPTQRRTCLRRATPRPPSAGP
jgi:hypothetical protein